jgi:aconitate hydratase
MLPLWFKNPADYEKISGSDKLSILNLNSFAPGKELTVEIKHKDGSKDSFQVTSSINEGQWEWFKNGSALNLMAKKAKQAAA